MSKICPKCNMLFGIETIVGRGTTITETYGHDPENSCKEKLTRTFTNAEYWQKNAEHADRRKLQEKPIWGFCGRISTTVYKGGKGGKP